MVRTSLERVVVENPWLPALIPSSSSSGLESLGRLELPGPGPGQHFSSSLTGGQQFPGGSQGQFPGGEEHFSVGGNTQFSPDLQAQSGQSGSRQRTKETLNNRTVPLKERPAKDVSGTENIVQG